MPSQVQVTREACNLQGVDALVIAKVVGTVVSTVKHPTYKGHKLFIVQPLHLSDQSPDEAFIALDSVHAGVGDTVLVMREGNSARQITKIKDAPIISMIVGVLDSVNINEKVDGSR